MKREVMFIFIFTIFLVSASLIYAGEEEQVQSAYSCVESKINQTGCSSLPFEERFFSALATNKCMSELSRDNSSNECWPKSGCTIKSTAQAILVLNGKVNTTKAEKWLLSSSQIGVPQDIDWFLEIESTGATQCKITYSGTAYNTSISANKKISRNAGPSLTLAQNNYWLEIAPALYNKEITISCNNSFITTLLFKKKDLPTVHVSDTAHSSESNGDTNEIVKSFCFGKGGNCDYESSLWASLVLYSLDKDYSVSDFMPYLVTMMDEDKYQRYLPESFLYIMTDKFRTELLLKQKAQSYWEVSGDRYFDTALALFPFPPDSYDLPTERSNSVTWLLKNQERSGCWNNNNLKDTAFLLYSIWPKGITDCPIINQCKIPSQNLDGECSYSDVQCGIDNDGCCVVSGCAYAEDNDCPDTRCTSNDDCSEYEGTEGPYCSGGDVYEEISTGECDATGTCIQNVDESLVQSCSGSETCEGGECVPVGVECGGLFGPSCSDGEDCVSGICVPAEGCTQLGCPDGYTCTNDECVPDEITCGFFKLCPDGENCLDGLCIPNTCAQDGCPDGQVCIADECIDEGCTADNMETFCAEESCKATSCDATGTCRYNFLNCTDDDYCCNPGCNSSNDNDCGIPPECTSNATCAIDNYVDGPYCSSDLRKVYSDFYNYSCESESCISTLTTKLIETCTSEQECLDGECVGETPINDTCVDDFDCGYDEQCIDEECIPYECVSNGECNSGNCTGGYCVSTDLLDCTGEGYFCTSTVNCENSFGAPLENYFCSGVLSVCCDTEPILRTCSEEGGDICTSDEECLDGTLVGVSDTMSDETCCLIGTCEIKTETTYCTDEGGTCRESCGSDEEEKSYTCDAVGDTCCVPGETTAPSRLWILIVVFLLLIALAVVGIVFRDKLRVQWIKLKDKLGGKKDKKMINMPMTTHSNINPQGRILPRRIFPPGQGPQQPLQRPPQQPANQMRRPMQTSTQNKPSQTVKKPEEKPKNELDDVLKKLKEMGK